MIKCLVLDHDNTAFRSVPDTQYLAISQLAGDIGLDMGSYLDMEYDGDLVGFLIERTGLSQEQLIDGFVEHMLQTPSIPYGSIPETIRRFNAEGGIVCVVSNSPEEIVLNDYAANDIPAPERVYGYRKGEAYRKPSVLPLEEIMADLFLDADRIFVLDDRLPGLQMARAAGVRCGLACWGHTTERMHEDILAKADADCIFQTVVEFKEMLFEV